jgi:copper(I)-binding protein
MMLSGPHTVALVLVACLACNTPDPIVRGIQSSEVSAGPLRVRAAWGLPPFTNAPLPGYLRIINTGTTPDTLLGARSDVASHAMLHGTEGGGGAMTMLSQVVIPSGDSVVMAPGGLHLMFEGLQRRIVAGDTVAIVLRFARAGEVSVLLPVVSYELLEALGP